MLVKIDVNTECIKNGHHKRPVCCPVALAIKAHLKPGYIASVVEHRTKIYKEEDYSKDEDYSVHRIHHPDFVRKFINDYDLHENVKPIEFDAELPDEIISSNK